METVPEIVFRDFEPTPELSAALEHHIQNLERFFDGIIGCHVMIEIPHRRRRGGNPVHVRLEVTVPGRDLVVSRDPRDEPCHEKPGLALNDAFDEMKRRLQDYVRQVRGKLKSHKTPPHGHISDIALWRRFHRGVGWPDRLLPQEQCNRREV